MARVSVCPRFLLASLSPCVAQSRSAIAEEEEGEEEEEVEAKGGRGGGGRGRLGWIERSRSSPGDALTCPRVSAFKELCGPEEAN